MGRRWLALLLAAALLGGCDAIAGVVSGAVDTFPEPCPDENYGIGDGYDAAARDCLWEAYSTGKAASFKTTRVTQQRDPIVTTVTVRPGQRVEIVHDNSLDTFSNVKGKYTLSCSIFERKVQAGSERIQFFADNCRGDIRALIF